MIDASFKTQLPQSREKVKQRCAGDSSGHDWLHIERVTSLALRLAHSEGADVLLTELIALLHDVEDHKLSAPEDHGLVKKWLIAAGLGEKDTERICKAIDEISFKGAGVATPVSSLEAACVQDADRLDALGAIGIARTFAYGGHRGQPMYDPNYRIVSHDTFESYKNHRGNTVGHFFEKLLLLKHMMQTPSSRAEAEKRHRVMVEFLRQFSEEAHFDLPDIPE